MLAVVAAVLVAIVISIGTAQHQTSAGCIDVKFPITIGGEDIYECGAQRQGAVLRASGDPGGVHRASPSGAVAAECRKAGLPVGRARDGRRCVPGPVPRVRAGRRTSTPAPRVRFRAGPPRPSSDGSSSRPSRAVRASVLRSGHGARRPNCAPPTPACSGATPEDTALTGSTTDGVNTVIGGLDLRAGDEVLTSDEEHPGLLAPLGRARRRHGITVRVVPFAEIAGEVTSTTRLVACSHVSWVSGRVVDTAALAAGPAPVLLDAAQGDRRRARRHGRARVRLLRRRRARSGCAAPRAAAACTSAPSGSTTC